MRKDYISNIIKILLGLALFAALFFFCGRTQTVEAAIAGGTLPGNEVDWEVTDEGVLRIFPRGNRTQGRIAQTNSDGNNNARTDGWPWYSNRTLIKSVIIEETVGTQPDVDLAYMFYGMTNVTEIDLSGLTQSNPGGSVQADGSTTRSLKRMFSGCDNLNKIIGVENLTSAKTNNTRYMFEGCRSLTDDSFCNSEGEPLKTTIDGVVYADFSWLKMNKVKEMPCMFMNCKKLTAIDLSSWENDEALYNMYGFVEDCSELKHFVLNNPRFVTRPCMLFRDSYTGPYSIFAGCYNLETVDMSNITLKGRSDEWNYNIWHGMYNLFSAMNGGGIETLRKVNLSNMKVPGIKSFENMFGGCTALEEVNLEGFCPEDAVTIKNMFMDCSSLKSLDLSSFGKLPNIIDADGLVRRCTGLETLNLNNLDISNIGISYGEYYNNFFGIRESHHSYEGHELGIETLENLKTLSAQNSKVWIAYNKKGRPGQELFQAADDSDVLFFTKNQMDFASDAGPAVTIVTRRDYVDILTDRTETGPRGADEHAENNTNINTKDGHLNTAGACFLAPGVYTILDEPMTDGEAPRPATFYHITEMGTTTPTLEIVSDPDGLLIQSGNTVNTKEQNGATWKAQGNDYVYKAEGKDPLIRITYPQVATDPMGNKHDVIVEIRGITFKDMDRIPDASTYDRRRHDRNIVAEGPYYRTVLEALDDRLDFKNYAYVDGVFQESYDYRTGLYSYDYQPNNSPDNFSDDTKVTTQGSGTYIDFDIKVKDAKPDTSVIFYGDDLDVAHNYTWIRDNYDPYDDTQTPDACFDELKWENVTYGAGSEGIMLKEGTDKDSLTFAEHTGLQVLDGNYVVGTGSDLSTSWSGFYARASAKKASYTWTSGIACTTKILKNTINDNKFPPVFIDPTAKKHVDGAAPEAPYDDEFFTFDLKAATGVAGTDYGTQAGIAELPNLATDPENTQAKNRGEDISFDTLEFKMPIGDSPRDLYIYEITEEAGEPGAPFKYDTGTKFYIQAVVFRPQTNEEIAQGTRAEVITGTKRGSSDIVWDIANVTTVFAPETADEDPVDVLAGTFNNRKTGETESKSIKRTINYIYEDTNEPVLDANGDPIVVVQELSYTRTVIDWTDGGEPVWSEWTAVGGSSMPAATSPTADREGFIPARETVDATGDLTPDDDKAEKYPDVTVLYRKPPEAGEKKTYGGRGETQKGTPPFTPGTKPLVNFTLIDPTTEEPTDTITIDGVGTYTVDRTTGEVTFVPDPDFIGQADTVIVRGTDENGETADGLYTPTVVDNQETTERTQTITYIYEDGTPVTDENGDPLVTYRSATFVRTGTVDPETGAVTWNGWEEVILDRVDSPAVKGYEPDKYMIEQTNASPDNWPEDEVVIYSKLPEPTDPTVPEPADPTEPEPTDPPEPEPTASMSPLEPTTPTEPTAPTEPTNPTEPSEPTEPTQPTEPTNPTEPQPSPEPIVPTTPADTTSAKAPKTSDTSDVAVYIGTFALAILSLTGAFLYRRRRGRK